MGSSHGLTRIIRLAYHEDPSYVPLLRRAYALWRELEQASGEQVLHITGALEIGASGSDVLDGTLASCRVHDLLYTNTPDRHFIVDCHPEYPQVVIGGGFSGHGFKFCSVMGEILADLALTGMTQHDIGRFRLARFYL